MRKRIATGWWALGLIGITHATVFGQSWQTILHDSFDRDRLGENWLIVRGDWHIDDQQRLRIQRQWPSHSYLCSTLSLADRNMRVSMRVMLPAQASAEIYLQGGTLGWGGGGADDRVGVVLVTEDKTTAGSGQRATVPVAADQWHDVTLQLVDGHYRNQVDGKVVAEGEVPQGRNPLHSGLQMVVVPDAWFDDVKIETSPRSPSGMGGHDAAANRTATVEVTPDADHPEVSIRQAIASLPATGGVVLLPAARFQLRQTIWLREGVTLAGAGDQTILTPLPFAAWKIRERHDADGRAVLTLEGDHDLQPGDGVGPWGHPGIDSRWDNTGYEVVAVAGQTVTLNKRFTGPTLQRFHPVIAALDAADVEVRDLAIEGPAEVPAGVRGGFMVNPITMGFTSRTRLQRLIIRRWPGDGISVQNAEDLMILDCDISGCANGMHPGTTTTRTLIARNRSIDNASGLYFCWYNNRGVYFRNELKDFTGFPDAGDEFNVLAFNRLEGPANVTVGYGSVIFGNRMPKLTLFPQRKAPDASVLGPGVRVYGVPPRYFVVGRNELGSLEVMRYCRGNVLAANTWESGVMKPTWLAGPGAVDETPEAEMNVVSDGVPPASPGSHPLPEAGRLIVTASLIEPVVDGRSVLSSDDAWAHPGKAWQTAIDDLAARGGGTLLLPGGRYDLTQSLRLKSKVHLVGRGSGTVLLAPVNGDPSIVVQDAADTMLRGFRVANRDGVTRPQGIGVHVSRSPRAHVIGVDLTGLHTGARIDNSADIVVRDVRAVACDTGMQFANVAAAQVLTSSAVQCRAVGLAAVNAQISLQGIRAGLNRTGIQITGGRPDGDGSGEVQLVASNIHDNTGDGVVLEFGGPSSLQGNVIVNNARVGDLRHAGIAVGAATTATVIAYNVLCDDTLNASQITGIRSIGDPAEGPTIRHNVCAPLATRRDHLDVPAIDPRLQARPGANWTTTLLPSNDSLEELAARAEKAKP